MKNFSTNAGILLFSLTLSQNALGEGATKVLQPRGFNPGIQRTAPPPQQRVAPIAPTVQTPPTRQVGTTGLALPAQKPVRKIASVSDQTYGKVRVKKNSYFIDRDSATDMRVLLSGGISGMSSGDASMQSFRNEQGLGSNYLVGLGADVRFRRYFGVELDAYYGIAPTQTIVFDDSETQKKKLQHMGGMFNIKGQYPTYISNIKVTPKLGAGYAMLKLNQTTESELFAETIEASETLKGIYGTAGFDVEPLEWLLFSFDYSISLMGSGTFGVKSNSLNSDVELTDAKFDRLRLGVFVRVHPSVMVGGNYTMRSMKFSAEDAASSAGSLVDISNQESLNQIAGSIMFQF